MLHPHYEADAMNAAFLLKYFAIHHLNIFFPQRSVKIQGNSRVY